MKKDINKMDWNAAIRIKVSHLEWNTIVDTLLEEGYIESKIKFKTTKRSFPYGTFRFSDRTKDKELYLVNWEGNPVIFFSHNDDEKNESEHVTGSEAYKEINKRFKDYYGIALATAYGTWPRGKIDYIDNNGTQIFHYLLEQCNDALPAIIDYNSTFANIVLSHAYKADISSAYPYQATFPVTTMKKMLGPFNGAIEPPQGYVAYWIKSGHIIESMEDGADTRTLLEDPLYKDRHKFKDIPEKEEITYLLPYSKYSLAPIMYQVYSERKENPRAKGWMNSFFGKLRSRKEYQSQYIGHISALVYARHVQYMCKIDKILKSQGRAPMMYATDSIIWLGGPSDITENDSKYLGCFALEYEDCKLAYKSCGNYVLQTKENEFAVIKHQGVGSAAWKAANIKSLEDYIKHRHFKGERYNSTTHKFETKENIDI